VHGDVLRVEDVDLVRNGKHLLDGVDLSVGVGERWAGIGPNGASKSTLLSLLGATAHPTRGAVYVLGRRLGRVDMRELRSAIGHVDPRHRLDHPLTPLQVVLTGLTNSSVLPPRFQPAAEHVAMARDLLRRLGMAQSHHVRWPTMSQGERGRVLIARALMASPQLLPLDEPATGLDIAGREDLLDALDAIAAERPGLSTVLVTHHLEELPSSTSHALMLRAGQVIASGPITETLTSGGLSACFDHELHVERIGGRWTVRSQHLSPWPPRT
jgi:iron complex transport system ATP-binding protein